MDTLIDFRCRFEDAEIHNITSYDCKKSISIITKDGYCALPHILYEKYEDLMKCVEYCESNKTILRYFDLSEIVHFLVYMNSCNMLQDVYKISSYFEKIDDITMTTIKIYYLTILKSIQYKDWATIFENMKQKVRPKYEKPNISKTNSMSSEMKKTNHELKRTNSLFENPKKETEQKPISAGVLITTADAYTLTDGPSIFLTEDVSKIAHFYIQQSNIPKEIFQNILGKIATNNLLSEKIAKIERMFDDMKEMKETNDKNCSKKNAKMDIENKSPEIQKLYKELDSLKSQIHYITLEAQYIPNTTPHQLKWSPFHSVMQNAFVPNIEEETVKEIMMLEIENYQKVLLLMGIGLFMEGLHPKYLEIMKSMAYQQDLYLIIASSDYIYGTNYSFCHGFISKDLTNMTQQKTLQSLGRIGRNSIQQTYSVRFRDDTMINQLFMKQSENLEAVNMCRLFCSD
jgi:cell shape-determining protein MreC